MKKFIDVCMIVAGSFLFICCALLIVTYFLYLKNPEDKASKLIYSVEEQDAETIFAVDVDAAIGKVNIAHSDRFDVCADAVYADGFDVTVSDGVLYVRQETEHDIELFGWRFGYSTALSLKSIPEITVHIPYDKYLDYADIQLGVGKITIDRLECDRFVSQVGVGKIETGLLNVKEESAVQVAIGSFDCSALEAAKLYLENTVGVVDIDVPVGAPDFGVSYENIIGYLNIKDKTSVGYIKSSLTDPAADNRISLNCRVNVINIQ